MKYINTDLLKGKLKDIATEFKTGNYYLDNSEQAVGYENALIDFEQIIDSLQQEQQEEPDKSLDEAAEKSSAQYYVDAGYSPFPNVETAAHKSGFIAGAEWQKEQMLKEAVEGEIQIRYSGCLCAKTIRAINEDKFKLGDKVRIIIVKEEKK